MVQKEAGRLRQRMRNVVRELDRRLEHLADRSTDRATRASQRFGRGPEDARIGLPDLQGRTALRRWKAGRHPQHGIDRRPGSTVGAVLILAAAVAFLVARRRRG